MWEAVRKETNGRVETQVLAQNNNIPGSDPAALKMLVAGEIQFFTLMGGILARLCLLPRCSKYPSRFARRHAHRAMDGPLGVHPCGDGGEGLRLPRRRVRQRHAADW